MRKILLLMCALLGLGASGAWADDWTPSLSGLISVGEKVESITPASSASDNANWYLITQIRDGESAIYDNGTTIMRGATSATAASFNNTQAVKNASYLVRFIATGEDGIYNIQFGNGRFAASYASTPGNIAVSTSTTPGAYAFYNCNAGSGSYFGWNLGTVNGKSVNNNGAGYTVAFWNDGERSGTNTSDNAIWYVYEVSLNSTVATIDCSSDVIRMASRPGDGTSGTNPALFYNSDGDAKKTSDWFPKYITNTKIPVTIDCGTKARLSSYSGNLNAYETVTMSISVPSAYRIKSYSFGAQISNAEGTSATATPTGGLAVNINGSSVAEVSASNVNLSKTSVDFNGTTSSGTECLVAFTDFNIVVEEINSLSQSYGEEATVAINGFTGTFSRSDNGSSTWKNQWVAADPYLPLSINITASNMAYSYCMQDIDNISFNMACGSATGGAVYTITAPDGYLIKDYKLSVISAATAQTIKPSTLSGISIAAGISSPVTVKVNRVYEKAAQFTITGTNGNLKTTNFIVTLVKDNYTPDDQIYQIICERAGLAVAVGGTNLQSTCSEELNLAPSGSDTKQQFAFVQNDGNIYLYSVGEQKFLTKTKALKTYIGDPIKIFPTGNSDYPYAFKFSDDKVVNHTGSNVSIDTWGGTTYGSIDGGNSYKLLPQGTYSLMSTAEAKINSIVKSLGDLDDNTAYTISTDGRGNWYAPTAAQAVTSTEADGEVEPSSEDTKQQFAFVKDVEGFSNNYYLYSVSEKKFVTVGELAGATGTLSYNRALLGSPDLSQNVTFVASTNSHTYPTIVTVNGRNLGISTSYTPMVIDHQSTEDDGNNALIVPAVDDFDPSEAQLMLLQVHALELYNNTAGNVGYPKTTATAAVTLLTQAKNPTDYATLLAAYNAYLTETDIVQPSDGKVYTFTNVQKNGDKFYIYDNGGYLATTSTKPTNGTDEFICHVTNNKFAFISKAGYWFAGATHDNGGQQLHKEYNNQQQPTPITKFPSTSGSNLETTPEFAFGKIGFSFTQRANNTSAYGTVLLVKNNGDWNGVNSSYLNGTYSSAYEINEASDYYNKVNLTSDGTDAYASIYLPFPVTIPDGVTAYAVESENGTYAHMEPIVTNGILPKEKAAILKKDGQTENSTIHLSPAEGDGSYEGTNLLRGTVATEEAKPGDGTTYVLGKINGEIGLYEYTAAYLAPGKAYLNTEAGVKALIFDFGFTDGVQGVNLEQTTNDGPVFNLAGQRVQKAQKGIYIQNGKKVLVK